MPVHTYSSREFTRDVSAAKRATAEGPVFITDRGRPAYALLRIEDYHRLVGQPATSLLDVMEALPGGVDIDFEPPRFAVESRPAELD